MKENEHEHAVAIQTTSKGAALIRAEGSTSEVGLRLRLASEAAREEGLYVPHLDHDPATAEEWGEIVMMAAKQSRNPHVSAAKTKKIAKLMNELSKAVAESFA